MNQFIQMNRYLFAVIAVVFVVNFNALAQRTIAVPQIINYSNEVYKAGLQNWSVDQDSEGIMYFGNNEGLMTFDGYYWSVFPLPNSTIVRSVAVDNKNRIYVGGQDELGYFEADETGTLHYHSLVPLIINTEREFADVWRITIVDDGVFFMTNNRIFRYNGERITVDKPKNTWQYMGEVDGKLYAQSQEQGLMQYDGGFWKPLANHADLNVSPVTHILPYNQDTLLVTTLKNGLFYLVGNQLLPKITEVDNMLYTSRIYSGERISTDLFAFGTTASGLLVMDKQGRVVQKYMYGEGLQKNNIRDVFIDRDENIWLALDDGIDFIAINSAIKYIHPDKDNPISTYTMRIFDNKLYVGTSNGLYASSFQYKDLGDIGMANSRFVKIADTDGQVWMLNEINENLLMGHEDGAYSINGFNAKKIYSTPGTWLFTPVSRVYPSQSIIAGTYWGLQHISFDNGQFSNPKEVEGSEESLRFIHFDERENAVWVSHPYRGVFKLFLSKDLKKVVTQKEYGMNEGLSSPLNNYLFYIRNNILVSARDGIYEYDISQDKFVLSNLFKPLKGVSPEYMYEDKTGNIWFVSKKKLGVLDFSRSNGEIPYTLVYFPELDGRVLGGYESVYAFDNNHVFVGANKGGILLNYNKYRERILEPNVLLRTVKALDAEKNETILYGGHGQFPQDLAELSYKLNSFQFTFSSTLYDQLGNVEYSYLMEGFDKNWSTWNSKSDKEYTNLSPGKYTFNVKSRNSSGSESEVLSYSFYVLPAWYANTFSYIIYALVFLMLLYYYIKRQKRKLTLKHENELYLRQLELDHREKEVVRLKNEKLKADLDFKDRELVSMTMHLVQRGEVLSKIKDKIHEIAKKDDADWGSISFRQLMRLVKSGERTSEDWEKFSVHFNNANEGFFSNLKARHPDLTSNELKICAYLRMNLSSKEIAQLMNITIKGIEVGRYRLRKKLEISPETNLHTYLLQFIAE
ncbi:triple tyrosine motif-containing protein [Albibacterium bauzanense]|uniref:YXYXY domain-containing protein n=1 Tax=Albibacterium bauzanense TaxID=653929 RepID=A0A4V2PX39_9SPHI|nr:triple tyrosine motif-containing protein [Albibacterium bauzanense]TCK80611.1 YXYXY domain-containing protein [Albibacterium bauzanense]